MDSWRQEPPPPPHYNSICLLSTLRQFPSLMNRVGTPWVQTLPLIVVTAAGAPWNARAGQE